MAVLYKSPSLFHFVILTHIATRTLGHGRVPQGWGAWSSRHSHRGNLILTLSGSLETHNCFDKAQCRQLKLPFPITSLQTRTKFPS